MTIVAHHIAGAPATGAGAQFASHNPSDQRDLIGEARIGTAEDVAAAAAAAKSAFDGWRRLPGPQRANLLHGWGEAIAARTDQLAELIAREVGKPIREARGEVGRAVVICRYYAGEAVRDIGEVIPAGAPDTTQFTLRDPLGPVGLITPWNFPLAIPLWKAAPALAFGNTVVLKPSELSPAVAQALAETTVAAGLPSGVFNVVHGDGTTGAALVDNQHIRAVSFTGSTGAGAKVREAAARRNIKVQTEMGGKNVVIVTADADLDRAVRLTVAGAFSYAGQKCTATSRAVVDRSIAAEFGESLARATGQLKLGPVLDPDAAIGPMISPAALERIRSQLDAAGQAATYAASVPSDESWQHGNWVAPSIWRLDDPDNPLARDELFAPVLAVLEADDLEHAIAIANDTRYGLSASIFTRDIQRAFQYIREIEVGLVRVNGDTTGVDPHAPFGGVKASSSGSREQGRAARDFYTETRTVQIHA